MPYKRKTNRKQANVTPATITKFNEAVITEGNGGAAVRLIEPEYNADDKDEYRRAWLIRQKAKELNAVEYVDGQLQQGALEAVERVNRLVQSSDEHIATKNAHFVIDHVRGKALQRSETKSLNLNINAIID